MRHALYGRLPAHSTLLSGRAPRDEHGFQSQQLQIWYNHTDRSWVGAGEAPHMHVHSDECFLVLRGRLLVETEGERHSLGPGDYACFPAGTYHRIVEVEPPLESLMIRAPSIEDKVYQPATGLELPAPPPGAVAVEEWTPENPRWPELLRLVVTEQQTEWMAFSAAWHRTSHVLVALDGDSGQVVGFLRFVVQPIGPDMDCPTIEHEGEELTEAKILAFGVPAKLRRRGIGRRLQQAALARARALGCYQVRSRTDAGHPANYHLKLSMGFAAHPVSDRRGEAVYFVMPLR